MSEEQTQVFNEDFESFVRRSFAEMNNRFTEMNGRLAKLEARAYDTKPIWEQALAEILEVKEKVESLDRRMKIITLDIGQMRGDINNHEQRLERIEQR